jgi:hypothetical protein
MNEIQLDLGTFNKKMSTERIHMSYWQSFHLFEKYATVEPLLSGTPLSGHPLLKGHISKSRIFCNKNNINYPSIKRPPLLGGRGHPKNGPK